MLFDGESLSAKIKDELKGNIDSYKETPIIALISVGKSDNNKYASNIKKICEYVGMSFLHINFDNNTSEKKIIKRIKELNKDKYINGIIIDYPLSFDSDNIINSIDINKDVDSLRKDSIYKSPVSLGINELFKYYNIDTYDKCITIIGKNRDSLSLMNDCFNNSNVTLCNSNSNNIIKCISNADIVINCDRDNVFKYKDSINDKSILIDFNVMGVVGPMNIIMVLKNTFNAYKKQNGIVDMCDLWGNDGR